MLVSMSGNHGHLMTFLGILRSVKFIQAGNLLEQLNLSIHSCLDNTRLLLDVLVQKCELEAETLDLLALGPHNTPVRHSLRTFLHQRPTFTVAVFFPRRFRMVSIKLPKSIAEVGQMVPRLQDCFKGGVEHVWRGTSTNVGKLT